MIVITVKKFKVTIIITKKFITTKIFKVTFAPTSDVNFFGMDVR